jgi:hypothetical protein
MRGVSASALCAWSAEDMDLAEFGDMCRDDVSHTIAELVGNPCRSVQRGRATYDRYYLVLWEKR